MTKHRLSPPMPIPCPRNTVGGPVFHMERLQQLGIKALHGNQADPNDLQQCAGACGLQPPCLVGPVANKCEFKVWLLHPQRGVPTRNLFNPGGGAHFQKRFSFWALGQGSPAPKALEGQLSGMFLLWGGDDCLPKPSKALRDPHSPLGLRLVTISHTANHYFVVAPSGPSTLF